MDLTNIYRIFYPNTKEYIFFSTPRGSFSKTGHKSRLKRYKNIEIIPCILPDYHGLKLDFNNRNIRKQLSVIPVSGKKERKLKTFWNLMKMKAQHTQIYGTQ